MRVCEKSGGSWNFHMGRSRRSRLDNWLGMREILRTLQVEVSDFVSAVSTPIAGLEAHLKPISDIIRYIEARGYSI